MAVWRCGGGVVWCGGVMVVWWCWWYRGDGGGVVVLVGVMGEWVGVLESLICWLIGCWVYSWFKLMAWQGNYVVVLVRFYGHY